MITVVDLGLLHWVNSACSNWLFDATLPVITYLGSTYMGFLFGLILFISTKSGRSTLFYMISFGINAAIFEALKYGLKRSRPFVIHDVILRISSEEASRLDSSFPSAHSTIAFMIATTLSHRYGKYRYLWYSIAGLVALSRVYLGVHYPSDVFAGVAIGYGVTKAIILAAEGGDRGEKAGTLPNRRRILRGESLEDEVSDERASREDGAVSRR
jgi:undecaprenyl-diphosphatase